MTDLRPRELATPIRVALLATVLWVPLGVSAQQGEAAIPPPPTVENANKELDPRWLALDATLMAVREERRRARKWEAALGITTGLVLAGFSGWRLIADPGANQLARGLGVMFMGFAALSLAQGFTALGRPQHEEELSIRYHAALADGLTAADVARFEGELYAAARSRWRQRKVNRWFGFARAIGGVVVAGLLPLAGANKSTRRSGYIVGGLFVTVGMVEFGRSFKPSAAERAWRDYRLGL